MKRRPYHPFSDLKEFPDLAELVQHILESISVEKVVAVLPANVDAKMVDILSLFFRFMIFWWVTPLLLTYDIVLKTL